MQKYWKLWHGKRLLAMLLAVTMTAGSLPSTTAFAAELPAEIVEAPAEELDADNSENQMSLDDSENEPGDLDDVQIVTGENGEGEKDEPQENEIQALEDGVQPQADAELKEYSFTVGDYLRENCKKVYSGSSLTDNYPWSNYEYYVTVYTNEDDGSSLAYSDLAYQAKWQVKKDDTFTDMPANASPVNAGEYRLHIVIPAVEGVSKESSYDIPVEITKAEAVLTVNLEPIAPGSQVKDIKIASASAYSEDSGAVFYYNATAASSDLGITLKVKDPYTGAEQAGETKLFTTVDYVVAAEPVFTDRVTDKDNYVLEPVTFPLRMQGLIGSEVSVTLADKWKEGGRIVYTYNGSAIAAPAAETDYTMEVVQYGVTGQDGKPVKIEAAAAQIAYAWYDDNGAKMDSAPTDAGTYYYNISYQGETGLYDGSSYNITVEVQPMTLTLVPKWKENNRAPVLYPGMSEYDVLSAVDYDIKNAEGKVLTATDGIDRDHMWGTTYYNTSTTMPYEPVFKLQIEQTENDVTSYADNNGSNLAAQGKYRVIFSGNKAAYRANGNVYDSKSINSNNETGNYTVNVTDEVLTQNVLAVTVEAGSAAEIDITGILKDGAGATLENPIQSVYQAKQIYEKRAEYKKAKVTADGKTLAQNADKQLTYTWSRNNGTAENPNWRTVSYTNSPSDAGTYKLEVSYKDPTNQYHAASKSVYYVIEKQKVKVVPKSAPKALTETGIYEYTWNSEFGYEIQTADGQKLTWDEYYYEIHWIVTKEAGTEYVDASGEMFAKDVKYRLEVDELELSSNLANNYVDYEETVTGTGETAVTKKTYLHETLPIELEVMGTTEILIKVDPTKQSAKTKVYSGEAVSLAEDIKNGLVTVVKKSDGTPVTDVTLEYRWYSEEDYDYVSAPVNGGSYTLYAYFEGNTTYKKVDGEVKVADITITPKELTVEAAAKEPVAAGTAYYNAYEDSKYKFTGVVDRDANAFTYQYFWNEYYGNEEYGFPAFNHLYTDVKDAKGNDIYGKLRGNAVYTLTPNMQLNDFYSRNYKAVGKDVSFTTVRGNSKVRAVANNNIEYTAVADTIDGMTHTIKPTAGIKYSGGIYGCGDNDEGNFIALRIDIPAEYEGSSYTAYNNASYKNSIEGGKAKGYVIGEYSGYIVAAFDASAKDKKEFDIRWEEGYIEHFVVDFTGAVLLEDLSKAVEPKSIAFNAPDTKMVVGGTQQLDVKLTKKLQSDIIRLQYKTATEEEKKYLSVDSNTGYVTALKAGKANVVAYPVRWEDGQFVKIPGAPEAKVAITITEVTAPKVQKVQTWGNYAGVTYGQVNDGYRREIYVLKGKNIKADEFEDKIASMRNEQWRGTFEIAPVYKSGEWTVKKNAYQNLGTLEPETDYTVYVRNVSGIRTLSDGSRVVASASGSVKSFKTTKLQVIDLDEDFAENQPVTYDDEYGYEVELLKGSIQISTTGRFALSAQTELAADASDYAWYPLPLSADLKKAYVAPKLVYQIAEISYSYSDKAYDYDDDYGYYYVPTTRAAVNNSGKIQLKEAGYVYTRVYDSISGVASEWISIRITVNPKSIVGKKVQLQVGQSVSLASLVDYKDERNKVIKGSFSRAVEVTEETRKKIEKDEHFVLNGSTITAVKPNGNLEGLVLTDKKVGGEATASVKSTTLAPATGLNATEITDKYADMWFQYAGYGNMFRIDVVDGRGRTIESTLQNESALRQYDEKGHKYYTYRVAGLTQQSNYTVKITAIYKTADGTVNEEAPKAVSKAIKTTKMPASYKGLTAGETGGIDIYVTSLIAGNRIGSAYISSGNTYTLIAAGEQTRLNEGAKVAVTDTLTWTSSNSKVATVKANAGTYTATFKAVRAGYTVIEVKSKITKQVIARYGVSVGAVGSAYYYYGENEPLQAISVGTSTPGGDEITLDLSTDEGSVQYSFTAPSTGTYYFWSTGDYDTYGTLYDSDGYYLTEDDDSGSGYNFKISYDLTDGETVYIDVREISSGSFECTLHISMQNPAE